MLELKPIAVGDREPNKPYIIAGPCSAESPEQLLTTATALAAQGIEVFRAGVWKPRTKPGSFEGVGAEALEWLNQVKKETGMLTATEVATREHVEAALNAGIDILWIGARTSGNPFAMQEVADVLATAPETPVLVKNPMNPDLELWIGALQRLYNAGLRRLGAIHRGFSVYGEQLYRNQPQWRIPLELCRRIAGLPILCDPSHLGGKRELIAPLSQHALDMGFDGLIIESHCNPDCALSDKEQQITPDVLGVILENLVYRNSNSSADYESLNHLRSQIDYLDNELLDVLNRRMQVSREIGRYKKAQGMPVVQASRYDKIMNQRIRAAEALGMNPDFMKSVLAAIHEESVRQQLEIAD